MVKYLRVENCNALENLIYKMKPEHSSIKVSNLNDWMEKAMNSQKEMDSHEFKKNTFSEKLSYKGLVKYPDYYTTANGVVIDVENKKFIQLNDFFEFGVDIFEIIPELKNLSKLADFDLESLYEYYFLREDKKMEGFTDEEWQEFIQKGLNNGALTWTSEVASI